MERKITSIKISISVPSILAPRDMLHFATHILPVPKTTTHKPETQTPAPKLQYPTPKHKSSGKWIVAK